MTAGQNVKRLRERLGLSQTQLSELSGVPQTTISTIELRSKSPDPYTLKKLSKVLNVTVDELLSEYESTS